MVKCVTIPSGSKAISESDTVMDMNQSASCEGGRGFKANLAYSEYVILIVGSLYQE